VTSALAAPYLGTAPTIHMLPKQYGTPAQILGEIKEIADLVRELAASASTAAALVRS